MAFPIEQPSLDVAFYKQFSKLIKQIKQKTLLLANKATSLFSNILFKNKHSLQSQIFGRWSSTQCLENNAELGQSTTLNSTENNAEVQKFQDWLKSEYDAKNKFYKIDQIFEQESIDWIKRESSATLPTSSQTEEHHSRGKPLRPLKLVRQMKRRSI